MRKVYTQPTAELIKVDLGNTFICSNSPGTQDFGSQESSDNPLTEPPIKGLEISGTEQPHRF